MEWSQYKRNYSDFLTSMYRTEIVTYFADKYIQNTPVKQPESEKVKIPFLASYARRKLAEIGTGYKTDNQLMEAFAGILFDGQKERNLCYQELPLVLAHLEAFLAHTLTAIWETDPQLLQAISYANREIAKGRYSEVEKLKSEERFMLIEETLYDIFRKTLDSCFSYLTQQLGFSVDNQRLLVMAAYRRNAIIHNGGIINSRYLHNLNDKERRELHSLGLDAGSFVPVNYAYLTDVFNGVLVLSQSLFEQTSKRFFGVEEPLNGYETISMRQALDLPANPLEGIALDAIKKMGGPDNALIEIKKLLASGMSYADILSHWAQDR